MRNSSAWPARWTSCLLSGEPLAGGDAQLPADEVDAGGQLGHRVLDLEPGVHLDEVELAVGVRGTPPCRRWRSRRRGRPRARRRTSSASSSGVLPVGEQRAAAPPPPPSGAGAGCCTRARGRGGVAVGVAEDLHLDVPRRGEVALEVDARRARTPSRARSAQARKAFSSSAGVLGHRHADAAAAAGRLAPAPGSRCARPPRCAPPTSATTPSLPGHHRHARGRDQRAGPGSCPSSAPSPRAGARRRRCPPRCRRGRTRRSPRRSRSRGAPPRRRSPSPPRSSASTLR